MHPYLLGFREIDKTQLPLVGGKGANLGELSEIAGIRVPEGFCITTEAYREIIGKNKEISPLLDELSTLSLSDREDIYEISARIRKIIEGVDLPESFSDDIAYYLADLDDQGAYAVRSSATAEDLPTASFAGQQDTYLNIIGKDSILQYITKCWASLFTDRAVTYRIQNGFDHRKVHLAVVIQRMVFPQSAGVVFTADPITSNRKIMSIDASFGLGEALVSGLVNADNYKVRDGEILEKKISSKKLAIHALPGGGTAEKVIADDRQNIQTLKDEQILDLEHTGRLIESHFGCPQDIEWCFFNNIFYILQSRPITTLYPMQVMHDGKNHVYMSFSHQQMMTNPIKPLGLSFFQMFDDKIPLIAIGGRLYFDLARDLASPVGRRILLVAMGKIDPLMPGALKTLMKRKAFMQALPRRGKRFLSMGTGYFSWALPVQAIKLYRRNDATVVPMLIARNEASAKELQSSIANHSGDELFAFIGEELKKLKAAMYDSRSMAAVYVALYATSWINKKMEKWLGERAAADALSQSAPNNVTAEMGLDLLDVADTFRPYPEVMDYLAHANDETFFSDLARLEGGNAAADALRGFLERYGMRCSGEIDITAPRWAEQPTSLVPLILGNVRNFESNAHESIFEQGLLEATEKERDLISRLERLRGGKRKAKKTKRMISILRNFSGYREHPKFLMMSHYWIIKQALLREVDKLLERGVIKDTHDIYYLSFQEFREAVRTNELDYSLIEKRKEEYEVYQKLTPPRVITSEGEVMSGTYETGNRPEGALLGIPVSSGTVEGRARVILEMTDASLEKGDVLVTAFTDPSWTPLFVSVNGLVTEVGGQMTHGSVIAREYGLPAVVGVENATRLIKDGDRIRVNGTDGYVEVL